MQQMEPRVLKPGFNRRVYAATALIPAGRVATYGDIGTLLGSPRVARHVGYALAALQDADVPWHRVINARGRISARGEVVRAELQQLRLEQEGVVFSPAGVIDLRQFRWRPTDDELIAAGALDSALGVTLDPARCAQRK